MKSGDSEAERCMSGGCTGGCDAATGVRAGVGHDFLSRHITLSSAAHLVIDCTSCLGCVLPRFDLREQAEGASG